jgi:hypothetical protein
MHRSARGTVRGGGNRVPSRRCPMNSGRNLMDVTRLVERFATIHGRQPNSKHELESWFAKYASSPDGLILISHLALNNHDQKGSRTGLVRQVQTLYREVHGRDGSLTQIEKWMRSLDGKKSFDDRRTLTDESGLMTNSREPRVRLVLASS